MASITPKKSNKAAQQNFNLTLTKRDCKRFGTESTPHRNTISKPIEVCNLEISNEKSPLNENKAYVFCANPKIGVHEKERGVKRTIGKTNVKDFLKSPSKPLGDFCIKTDFDFEISECSSELSHSNSKTSQLYSEELGQT